jgi:hypothetical protein
MIVILFDYAFLDTGAPEIIHVSRKIVGKWNVLVHLAA